LDIARIIEIYNIVRDLETEALPFLKEKDFVNAGFKAAHVLGIDPQKMVHDTVSKSLNLVMGTGDADAIGRILSEKVPSIANLFQDFMKKNIDKEGFTRSLQTNAQNALNEFTQTQYNMKIPREQIWTFIYVAIVFICFTKVYELCRAAHDEAKAMAEYRTRIEQITNESIREIKANRQHMEDMVNQYFTKHLTAFSTCIDSMNAALLADDPDGYLSANADLQELFGRKTTFRTMDEFNELMGSDESFKL